MMPPIGVKAAVLSATRVRLTWTDTTLAGRGQRVHDSRYYVVRYNPKLARKQRLVNSTDLVVELFDLRPDTEYEFSVKVVKGQRRSTWSLSVFNRTLEAGSAFIYTLHSKLDRQYSERVPNPRESVFVANTWQHLPHLLFCGPLVSNFPTELFCKQSPLYRVFLTVTSTSLYRS